MKIKVLCGYPVEVVEVSEHQGTNFMDAGSIMTALRSTEAARGTLDRFVWRINQGDADALGYNLDELKKSGLVSAVDVELDFDEAARELGLFDFFGNQSQNTQFEKVIKRLSDRIDALEKQAVKPGIKIAGPTEDSIKRLFANCFQPGSSGGRLKAND